MDDLNDQGKKKNTVSSLETHRLVFKTVKQMIGFNPLQDSFDRAGVGSLLRAIEDSGVGRLQGQMRQFEFENSRGLFTVANYINANPAFWTVSKAAAKVTAHFETIKRVYDWSHWSDSDLASLALSKIAPEVNIHSKLFQYLTADLSNFQQAVELFYSDGQMTEFGTPSVRQTEPHAEEEEAIVKSLQQDQPLQLLNLQSQQLLWRYIVVLLLLADIFVKVADFGQAVEWVGQKMSQVSTAAEVKQIAQELPTEHRAALEGHRVVTRKNVNIRYKHSTDSAVVGQLQLGQVVEALDEHEGWLKIEAEVDGEDITGWIYKGFTAGFPVVKNK